MQFLQNSTERSVLRKSRVVSLHNADLDCSILDSGLTPKYGNYFLCECDAERRNAICEECFKHCHNGRGHKIITSFKGEEVCICGFKLHKGFNHIADTTNSYKQGCLFAEWAKNGYYTNSFVKGTQQLCLICKNFCTKKKDAFTKVSIVQDNLSKFECNCQDNCHFNLHVMLRKLRTVTDQEDIQNNKYDFDGITLIQFINLIQIEDTNYNNIFSQFKDKIEDNYKDIDTPYQQFTSRVSRLTVKSKFDENKYVNELHLTSHTLSAFALGIKNVYQLTYKNPIPKIEKYNTSTTDSVNEDTVNVRQKDSNSTKYYINCRPLMYFQDKINEGLFINQYIDIMKVKFDYKSRNIWLLKDYLTNIFYTFCFAKYFNKLPNFKINDLLLLSPIQRLIMYANKEYDNEVSRIINTFGSDKLLIDNLILIISKINKSNESVPELYTILNKLLKMVLLLVKWSFVSTDHVKTFCKEGCRIIANFSDNLNQEKRDLLSLRPKFKVLSTMMKIALFIAYKYNDQILLKNLKDGKTNNLSFFHMKSDVCKLVTELSINCMAYIRDLTPEYVSRNGKVFDIKDKYGKKKNGHISQREIPIIHHELPLYRCWKNIVKCCQEINSLIIGVPDCYLTGLKRILNNDFELTFTNYNKLISGAKLSPIVKNLRAVHLEIEKIYHVTFNTFMNASYILNSAFLPKLDEIINLCEIAFSSNEVGVENNKNSISNFDEDKALINNQSQSDNFMTKERSEIMYNNYGKNKNTFVAYLNFSFLIQSLFKYIQILYYIEKEPICYSNNQQKNTEKNLINNNLKNFQKSKKESDKNFSTNNSSNNNNGVFKISKQIFEKICSISRYYFLSSIDNAMMILASDIINSIELLNGPQLSTMLQLVNNVLSYISENMAEISINSSIVHLLKIAMMKSGNDLFLIENILDIIQTILHISFNDEKNIQKKLRKLVIDLYENTEKMNISCQVLVKDEICTNTQVKIIEKFLLVINQLFEGNSYAQNRRFLERILNKADLIKILTKKDIELNLRTQLLIFYRIVYIDTVMKRNKNNIDVYISLLINDPEISVIAESIDDQKYHRFYEKVLVASDNNERRCYLTEDCEIILNELMNFEKYIKERNLENQEASIKNEIKNYLNSGLLKTLYVYITKFSSLVFGCTGIDYVNFYQLLYYFLKFELYLCDNLKLFENDKKIKKNPFFNKTNAWGRIEKPIINENFIELLQSEVSLFKHFKDDISNNITQLESPTYDIYNFSSMYRIFKTHFNKILVFPTVKGFKDYFEKREDFFSDKRQEKMTDYLKEGAKELTNFQQKNFDIFLMYMQGKNNLEKSSFLTLLGEDNNYHNCKFRVVFIKNLLMFITNSDYPDTFGTYTEQSLWELFRLLEFNTTETQGSFQDIHYRGIFQKLLSDFTYHLMNIISYEFNPCFSLARHEYYLTLMIVKIYKYFCEEHNQTFQEVFFNIENGIAATYYPEEYKKEDHRIKEQIAILEANKSFLPSNKNTISNFSMKQSGTKLNMYNSMVRESSKSKFDKLSQIDKGDKIDKNEKAYPKPMGDSKPEVENFDSEDDQDLLSIDNLVGEKPKKKGVNFKEKASTFEYMLSILSKIILLSNWTNSLDEELNKYYYDLYFVILEFLIETIQGTKHDNLDTLCGEKKKAEKNLFGVFLLETNQLVLKENRASELSYQVRKDMMDFIMAFLEECQTPINGILEISSILQPISLLDCITSAMISLYDDMKKEEIEEAEAIAFAAKQSTLKRSYSSNKAGKMRSKNVNLSGSQGMAVEIFTPEMKEFFEDQYYSNSDFPEEIKFGLANRMYQFFKMYSLEDKYKNEPVCDFYEKMEEISEDSVINSLKKQQPNVSSSRYDEMDLKKRKNPLLKDKGFLSNYLCVKFFESITRTVLVNNPSGDKLVRVIFTLNPYVPLLSNLSKNDFIDNVDRDDRYTKLASLVESCDYFFGEIIYKKNQSRSNKFLKTINDIDFYLLEICAFVITLALNLFLICVVKGQGDSHFGHQKHIKVIQGFALANLAFNILSVILWLISKYSLFHLTEVQKLKKKKKEEREQNSQENNEPNDEEEDEELTIWDEFCVCYEVVIAKGKLNGFFWNIIFSAVGYFTGIQLLYIIQILGLCNLSSTLKSLLKSMTFKANQLFSVFYLTLVFNHVFGGIAFFNFSKDFIKPTDFRTKHYYPEEFDFLYDVIGGPNNEDSHIENECGSLIFCSFTHLDYGMRFDGGIADRMLHASYTFTKNYYVARFLYEEFYFILLVILMLNIIFGIIIDAFSELRNNELQIERDKAEICFICSVNKETCEKRGDKLDDHLEKVHNIWTYVEYMLGLRFVDIQDTNAINSFVMQNLENNELSFFPIDPEGETGTGGDS